MYSKTAKEISDSTMTRYAALQDKLTRLRAEIEKHRRYVLVGTKTEYRLDREIQVFITTSAAALLRSEVMNREDSSVLEIFGIPCQIIDAPGDNVYLVLEVK